MEQVQAYGKHLLIRFDDQRTLRTHFRMDGTWRLFAPGAPWRGGPAHQIRVVLATSRSVAVGYRLVDVDVVRTRDEHQLLGHLGPDILAADWDAAEALHRLRTAPARPVFEALLDQRNLAGIGTIYACESLFATGTLPSTPVVDVDDLAGVLGTARALMQASIADAGPPRRGQHLVHGRAGRACSRCGSILLSEERGEFRRRAVWCPTCQG